MNASKFGISSKPLHHAPYGPILAENLSGINAGKVAVITGGARGIGRAIALSLASSGAHVAVLDVLVGPLAETKTLAEAYGVQVFTSVCDVTDIALLTKTIDEVEKTLGPIDVLVNSVATPPGLPQWAMSFTSFWRDMEVNLKSYMTAIWATLPGMRARRSGVIINITSRAATVDIPFGMSYNTSKAAITRATSTLQEELDLEGLGDAVQVYALHPGGVPTNMQTAIPPPEILSKYSALNNHIPDLKFVFQDTPELCGGTCAYLASGKGKELRGLYIDVRQDIECVSAVGREGLLEKDLYKLTVNFISEYQNEP